MRLRIIAGLCVSGALAATACTNANASPTSDCGKSYCGTVTLVDTPLNWTSAGFGYNYTGYIDLRFAPAPPAGMRIGAQLNGASIDGSAVSSGSTDLRIPIQGSSIACQLTNPSTWTITDTAHPTPVLAFLTFNWNKANCN